ncbi:MAG: twin-arginine translocation signal domain-containing protein [Verrucomicrobiota bacterium]|nr:twin-arginine translocation signal domain-containing protein [Verrucomicrobiota bacterium]
MNTPKLIPNLKEKEPAMKRRDFLKAAGAAALGAALPKWTEAMPNRKDPGPPGDSHQSGRADLARGRLFPVGLPYRRWTCFKAAGFRGRVTGVIYNAKNKPQCGVPMGGIGTGCIDIEADGTLGYCTAFRPVWGHGAGDDGGRYWRDIIVNAQGRTVRLHDPSRDPMDAPFAAITLGKTRFILSTRLGESEALRPIGIEYWGHYPVADMEFTLDAPVQVGMRVWAPFIPGDVLRSNVPGCVFETRLGNISNFVQQGTFEISFPGVRERETGGKPMSPRWITSGALQGIYQSTADKIGYVLAAIGVPMVAESNGPAGNETRSGGTVSVPFQLAPNSNKIIRFVLAWYAPQWHSSWTPAGIQQSFTRMYTRRFSDALDVARFLAKNHWTILRSILAWQGTVYADESLPGWLRDGLVNILHLIAEESYWAAAKAPIEDWCNPEGGIFSLVEGTDADGQQSCIPCDWYGNLPILYFFPQLARSTLRAYTHEQRQDGCPPMTLGQGLNLTGPYQYAYQQTLNPCVYVDLVDRLWQRTGDDGVLKEFYPAVRKATEFAMNLVPGSDSVIATTGSEWYESMGIIGLSSHIAGIRLAHLCMVERMAEKTGDAAFAKRCRVWFERGKKALEGVLWTGDHYLLYYDPASGKKSDLILAYTLDGEWMARFHGFPGVFDQRRVEQTLATIKAKCDSGITPCGLLDVVQSDGKLTAFGGRMGGWCSMPASVFITAMNYLYAGQRSCGLEIAHDCLNNLVNTEGMTWDMPNMVRGEPGKTRRIYGFDYYQCMSLWGIPAALEGKDLRAACHHGGLVDQVLRSGMVRSIAAPRTSWRHGQHHVLAEPGPQRIADQVPSSRDIVF